MKKYLFLFVPIILMSCPGSGLNSVMTSEDEIIKDWLNSKLSASAEKVTDVKIFAEDTLLSLVPLQVMYLDCMNNGNKNNVLDKMIEYHGDAAVARAYVKMGQRKDKELMSRHNGDWRRVCKVVTEAGGKVSNNIEVIFDIDGQTPYLTGREYDVDLDMWEMKILSLE